MTPTAALTVSLSGPFARQGTQAAEGVRLWADTTGTRLTLLDDHGSKEAAVEVYTGWVGNVELLIGPYASGLVRAVSPLVADAGRVLWNHGGSADDIARPGVVCLPAPASSYFHGVVDEATTRGVDGLIIVRGKGKFARLVAEGAAARGDERELHVRMVDPDGVDAEKVDGLAVAVVGRYEDDIAVVRRLRDRDRSPALVGAVAAGIQAFGEELGDAAEGVVGPVQWWPTDRTPEVGPSGSEFAAIYQQRTGKEPSYVAAQAAAAGYLAHAAHASGLDAEGIMRWRTSTLLGDFAVDHDWRQVGHQVTTVRWLSGRMTPITP